jgi:transposase-like protein
LNHEIHGSTGGASGGLAGALLQNTPSNDEFNNPPRTQKFGHSPIIAKTIPNTSKAALQGFIHQYAVPGSVVYTDTHSSYKGIQFDHYAVNHTVGEYVRERAHTNGIESFWALLKRGHYGVFHYMSAKHLHRYVNEFSNRHNTAGCGTMQFINLTVTGMGGRRLTYKGLTNGN